MMRVIIHNLKNIVLREKSRDYSISSKEVPPINLGGLF